MKNSKKVKKAGSKVDPTFHNYSTKTHKLDPIPTVTRLQGGHSMKIKIRAGEQAIKDSFELYATCEGHIVTKITPFTITIKNPRIADWMEVI
jgi:hypothetical protein